MLSVVNRRFENLERVPYAYNAGGGIPVRERAIALTDPAVLAENGEGVRYPLYFNELAANGNYLELEEISVRRGVCGDPRLVRTCVCCRLLSLFVAMVWCGAVCAVWWCERMYIDEGELVIPKRRESAVRM